MFGLRKMGDHISPNIPVGDWVSLEGLSCFRYTLWRCLLTFLNSVLAMPYWCKSLVRDVIIYLVNWFHIYTTIFVVKLFVIVHFQKSRFLCPITCQGNQNFARSIQSTIWLNFCILFLKGNTNVASNGRCITPRRTVYCNIAIPVLETLKPRSFRMRRDSTLHCPLMLVLKFRFR